MTTITSFLLHLLLFIIPIHSLNITISHHSLHFPSCSHLNGSSYSLCEQSIRSKDEILSKRTDHCCQLHMLPDCTLKCLEKIIDLSMDKGSRLDVPYKCKQYMETSTSEGRHRRGKKRRQRCLLDSSRSAQKCFVHCINKQLMSSKPNYKYNVEKECSDYDRRQMDICVNTMDRH